MRRVKTAVIGCGKVAHLHAKAFAALPGSEFVAACDRTPARVGAFAAEYGVRAFTDIREMAAAGIEAVAVCTPHPIHAESGVAALEAGMHVLVEKPLGSTVADCDRMIAAAAASRVVLATVCQRRFFPPCQRIRRAIDEGKLGRRPVLGTVVMHGWRDEGYYRSDPWRGTWAGEGGGVLVNQAPHQLDLLLWYMGEAEEVYGAWANLNHPYIEVEDTAVAVVRFRSGGLGSIVVSNSQDPALYAKVHVHGENGASAGVQTDGGAMFIAGVSSITEPPVNDLWTVRGEEHLLDGWKREDTELFGRIDPIQRYHDLQVEDFLRAVATGSRPLIDGADGRRTVELIEAIYRSDRERRPVRLPLDA